MGCIYVVSDPRMVIRVSFRMSGSITPGKPVKAREARAILGERVVMTTAAASTLSDLILDTCQYFQYPIIQTLTYIRNYIESRVGFVIFLS